MSVRPVVIVADTHPQLVLDVPSGQPVEFYEVLTDTVGDELWVRFRFLAPQIARSTGSIGFEQAEPDLEHLCTEVALPYLAEYALEADIVAVTLLDRPVPFGVSDAEATQFIDVFRVSSGQCVWEGL
ncbi:DUF6497 family protein [Roseobacter sinensis]|uniref:DUF6497 family protein n=1 Tax=Roseobacter sinensis TaxID=2931391 RepID=A0ABT3BHB3_9RHOB|nr:DUF6497 family protein [Roseobacter sp. WL0113]MCV3272958.1 DUF6497 family protein [Roseobacter sp. WL0113]